MSLREGLEFGAEIESDCAPLHDLVATMLGVTSDIHVLRDPTRGGLGTSLNEIAAAARVGVDVVERSIPVPEVVANACAFLGLDPLYVANEGKLVAFVARDDADAVLAAQGCSQPPACPRRPKDRPPEAISRLAKGISCSAHPFWPSPARSGC
jgi:hydrogenase expression/formation protein HypE